MPAAESNDEKQDSIKSGCCSTTYVLCQVCPETVDQALKVPATDCGQAVVDDQVVASLAHCLPAFIRNPSNKQYISHFYNY